MSVVLFLSGQSMGDALRGIGRSYRPLFEELGHEFIEIGLQDPNAVVLLNQTARERPIALAFSHVGMCADLVAKTSDGETVNFWEGLRIPYISLYGDSPAYFFDRHVMPSVMAACIYAFPEHRELRKSLPKVQGLLGVYPPIPMDCIPKGEIDFRLKERGRLLFLKNGNDPEGLINEWRDSLPSSTFVMLAEIASYLESRMPSDPGNQIDRTITKYFEDRGVDIVGATKLRLFFIAQLDDYLRRVKSTMLARALMDFPIDMFGYNWEHLSFSGKRINFTPGGDYARSAPMIRDSLGLIDMSPNTSNAPHERPLRAFGSYTLCLTNEQTFFQDNVAQSGKFSFKFDSESIKSKVADVIAHPKQYVEIGVEAAESFRSKFSRVHFAEMLLETASALRLAIGDRPAALQPYFVWPPKSL